MNRQILALSLVALFQLNPAAAAPAAAAPAAGAPAEALAARTLENASAPADAEVSEQIRLEVRLGERKLHVIRDGKRVKSYPVSIGKSKHPTPRGDFRVRRVIWNPRWVPPKAAWAKDKTPKAPGDPENPMGKVKLFFQEPDYYIHGTEQHSSLGRAESHGCIRMSNRDVVDLAKLVMASGGQAREESWFRRVTNRVKQQQEVRLSKPVPLSIKG